MAIYIKKPDATEAVKWDGTAESKQEISLFLNKHDAGIVDVRPDDNIIVGYKNAWQNQVLKRGDYVSWNGERIGIRNGNFFEKLYQKA